MKNLFKFFLVIMVFQVKIFTAVKKEKQPEFFIIRFAETGNRIADKELSELLINRSIKKGPILTIHIMDRANVPQYIKDRPGYRDEHTKALKVHLGDKYFNEKFKINEDIVIPIDMGHNRLAASLELDVFKSFTSSESLGELPVKKGKKYIFRNRQCTGNELRQPNKFVQLSSEGNYELNLCVEIQDIAQQKQKLKAELEQALPDMPPELRNIVQEYVGTDIT